MADSQYKFSLSSRISEIRLHESAERHSRDAGRSPSVPRGPARPGCCGVLSVPLVASSPHRRQVARAQLVGLQERLRILMRSDLDSCHKAFSECLVVAWHPFHYSQPSESPRNQDPPAGSSRDPSYNPPMGSRVGRAVQGRWTRIFLGQTAGEYPRAGSWESAGIKDVCGVDWGSLLT